MKRKEVKELRMWLHNIITLKVYIGIMEKRSYVKL